MSIRTLIHRGVRVAYPYGAIRTVLRGPLRGMCFVVRPAMAFTFAWHAPPHWDWFCHRLAPGMVVYDIGANRGQMALAFARAVGPRGKVVSFEPVPALFSDLRRNLEMNDLPWVVPVEAAASDQAGEAHFLFDPAFATQGKLDGCEPAYVASRKSQRVRTVVLDDVAGRDFPAPQFLKIGTEGGAAKVLAGAQRVLREDRPAIYVELHGPEEQRAARDLMQNNGYVLRRLSGELVSDPTERWVNPLWCMPGELA
jgi:FkbM family methyltransferase